MPEALIQGVRVVDAAGEPAAMTGRLLADLGAEVVRVEPPGGDPLRRVGPFRADVDGAEASLRFAAWHAGATSVECAADDPRLDALLAGADIVIDTPGFPGALELDPARAPHAIWVRVTPFGLTGPRSGWRASDLGSIAASGNMYSTGYADRPPVRCTEPSAYAHVGPEAAMGALSALASGQPQIVDVSISEAVIVANMGQINERSRGGGSRGRREGNTMLGFQEIWPCKDGWLSFGIRGGVARVPTYQKMTRILEEEGLSTPDWSERDWPKFNQHDLTEEEKVRLQEPVARYFERHTMIDLYESAASQNIMLATCNSPREIHASSQISARDMFCKLGDLDGFPKRFVLARSGDGEALQPEARRPAPTLGAGPLPDWEPRTARAAARTDEGAWAGTKIVEFGAGAAGPIASRYFAENGATVIRVESRSRPEFLRYMAVAAGSPQGLEGSAIFNALNVGKRSVTLNLKSPEGVEVARRLIEWSDLVLENFAPKAMRGFGLDYDSLVGDIPNLVMVSSCMNGQTGPHRDYPGFGSQGSALAGYTLLTGDVDRAPVGPYGTITDSLAPRFAASAMAAAILYHRRTGRGVYIDVSQVEAATYSLSPWLLDFSVNGNIGQRTGNRSSRSAPHGAFPCQGDDRWVAVAVWTDEEWARLAPLIGLEDASLATLDARQERVDEVEAALRRWTAERTREQAADELQALGIEAVPILDLDDLLQDEQLAARGHLVELDHPALGRNAYQRNGFRLSNAPGGYARPTPTLGEHTDEVLADLLGYTATDIERLKASGGVE